MISKHERWYQVAITSRYPQSTGKTCCVQNSSRCYLEDVTQRLEGVLGQGSRNSKVRKLNVEVESFRHMHFVLQVCILKNAFCKSFKEGNSPCCTDICHLKSMFLPQNNIYFLKIEIPESTSLVYQSVFLKYECAKLPFLFLLLN